MASQKDKDYHKLRNPDKYFGTMSSRKFDNENLQWYTVPETKEVAEAKKNYDKLWAKYGMKSMVADKRRRNITRKSNQKTKPMLRQKRRAKEKEVAYKLITFNEVVIEKERKWNCW